ncbi:MAG: hypothetical protein JSS82_03950 [Bacteroidetes bacterium]|nr:hypothetical protein [Bacteroidota bacterium]
MSRASRAFHPVSRTTGKATSVSSSSTSGVSSISQRRKGASTTVVAMTKPTAGSFPSRDVIFDDWAKPPQIKSLLYEDILNVSVFARAVEPTPTAGNPVVMKITKEELKTAMDLAVTEGEVSGNLEITSRCGYEFDRLKTVELCNVSSNYTGDLLIATPEITSLNTVFGGALEGRTSPFVSPEKDVVYSTHRSEEVLRSNIYYAARIPPREPLGVTPRIVVYDDGYDDSEPFMLLSKQQANVRSFHPDSIQLSMGYLLTPRHLWTTRARKISEHGEYAIGDKVMRHMVLSMIPMERRNDTYRIFKETFEKHKSHLLEGELPISPSIKADIDQQLQSRVYDYYPPHNLGEGLTFYIAPPPCKRGCSSNNAWTCSSCNVGGLSKSASNVIISAEVKLRIYLASESSYVTTFSLSVDQNAGGDSPAE